MVDLFLDGAAPRRRASALFEQLRDAVVSGRLAPQDRLPTTRHLAAELGVARSTVATVYARLVAEGYAEGRVGDGTFVATTAGPAATTPGPVSSTPGPGASGPSSPGRPSAPLGPRTPWTSGDLGTPPGGWRADLRAGRPDPDLFPVTEWRRCVTGTLHEPPPGYGHATGLPTLRRVLSAWVARSRGVAADPDRVIVTAGAQGAFDLCARALLVPGDTVAVEHPGYAPARAAFAAHGARIVPVPVDGEGLVVDEIPPTARIIVVTPSHQAPTGAVLSSARRRRLLAVADALGAVIVEDDYDTEYRYVDRPLEPLHRLDTNHRTIYVGTFSKTLTPSLRLGFVVAPDALVAALADTRHSTGDQPPHLTQSALAAFVASGGFDRHLRRTRRHYRARRDHLVGRLDELHDAGLVAGFTPCPAGLHTTVALLPGRRADTVAAHLRAEGIAISTTAADRLDGEPGDLVVGFGLADRERLDVALDALAAHLTAAPS